MIYSCTMFGREFAQLDLKISEELPYVDKLIVVEATKTHANRPKPLHLPGVYTDPKIDLVIVGEQFKDDVVHNEAFQRNYCLPKNLADNDVVFYGDDDEINYGEEIPWLAEQARQYGLIKLKLSLYHYKINLRCNNPDMEQPYPTLKIVPKAPCEWIWSFAVTGKYIRERNRTLTQLRYDKAPIIDTKGKHFSYLGGPEEISYKVKNSLHCKKWDIPEYTDTAEIQKKIDCCVSRVFEQPTTLTWVPVDSSYPKTILNNIDKWKQHIASKPSSIY
jgi:hypothetical protein